MAKNIEFDIHFLNGQSYLLCPEVIWRTRLGTQDYSAEEVMQNGQFGYNRSARSSGWKFAHLILSSEVLQTSQGS